MRQVSQVLDSAAKRIDRDLAASPDVRAELQSVIAQSYQGLGRYDDAEPHFKKSLQLRERSAGRQSPAALTGLRDLGRALSGQGHARQRGEHAARRRSHESRRARPRPTASARRC